MQENIKHARKILEMIRKFYKLLENAGKRYKMI